MANVNQELIEDLVRKAAGDSIKAVEQVHAYGMIVTQLNSMAFVGLVICSLTDTILTVTGDKSRYKDGRIKQAILDGLKEVIAKHE